MLMTERRHLLGITRLQRSWRMCVLGRGTDARSRTVGSGTNCLRPGKWLRNAVQYDCTTRRSVIL